METVRLCSSRCDDWARLDVAVSIRRGNETLVIYSDNGTVGLREWAKICGSRAEATVGHNYDDDRALEVMSIPTTISWHPGALLLLVTPSSRALAIFRRKMLQQFAI